MTTYISADEAVRAIRPGHRVFVQGAAAFPQILVDALVRRGEPGHPYPISDVEIFHFHTNGHATYVEERFAGIFHHRALFVAGNTREAVRAGRATYVPVFLSDVPQMFRSGHMPIDAVLLNLSPPDEHGYCSLGTSIDATLAAMQVASIRLAQINPQMPRTLGDGFVHISQLTHVVSVDEPLFEATPPTLTDVQHRIGEHLATLIPDGATLQLGIGGIPDAVLCKLANHKDLGIHSEVVSDGILPLVRSGVITGARKTVNRGKIVATFLNGTRRLFDFVDDNPMVEMRPCDYTNDTRVIFRLDNMVAINSAIEIDLTGQVCAESMGSDIYSGVGGQMDFLRGAALSKGGRPIVALSSTAKDGTVSRIVPSLQPGAGVTTTRAHVHYVATEFGVINLHGLDLEERAQALIALAHPDFRDELKYAARRLHLLRS